MGTVRIGMVATPYNGQYNIWTPADIKRASKPKCMGAGHKIRLPRTDPMMSEASMGKGLTWEEGGRTLRAQIWCPGPYVKSYWMLVYGGFPGEMRQAMTDGNGGLSLMAGSFDSHGHKCHADGTRCHGSAYCSGGCKSWADIS